jgi:hypothetical protein
MKRVQYFLDTSSARPFLAAETSIDIKAIYVHHESHLIE